MSKKPVVLFLIDTLNTGGTEKSLLALLPCFKRYTPVVCHVYRGDQLKEQYLAKGIQVHSISLPPPYNFSKAIPAVRQACDQFKPDIIHSSLFKSDIISRFVARKLKVPLVNSLVNN